MNADCILETIAEACSLAEALKAEGDMKGAREILDGVAGIQDRMLCLADNVFQAIG